MVLPQWRSPETISGFFLLPAMNTILSQTIITLFLCGDLMTGRGIDQILAHSAPPRLFEPSVRDARVYVEIAERANGPIPHRVDGAYVWGDAMDELRRRAPSARIANLETSLTAGGEPWPGKGIHYRMHPANTPLLTAAGLDVAVLANNHVLDWGYHGLAETLDALRQAEVQIAGAGRTLAEAEAPAVVPAGAGRVLVFAFGAESSGIPADWKASASGAGVNLLPDLTERTAAHIGELVRDVKRPGDVAIASLHWGGNWGYDISAAQRKFAHLLVERAEIDLVHGHSSHHPRPIEVYQGKLILYGCGDLVTDYEGIGGFEAYRGELGLMYFPRINAATGKLVSLEMVPMQMKKFRLNRASRQDTMWLQETLSREGQRLGTRVAIGDGNTLVLHWEEEP